ncbi:ATP-binding protein [Neiella marina]|uniref:ATP-binding protein n=1 Tax=Neiella holothuriorum TaxID=2870530 RepID=A0ABS7EHQ0_9GAMM|nr:AAA family ATPase [Neiella holothuriorum]MBW8191820.1 ATP-binding protein [Neiella holothuriorum]
MKIQATYNEHPDQSLNGNPLCEALSVETNDRKLLDSLTQIPQIQDDFWQLSNLFKKTQIALLDDLYIPPSPTVEMLYEKFVSLLLSSYRNRHPLAADTVRFQFLLGTAAKAGQHYVGDAMPEDKIGPAVVISGLSGMGKTVTVRTVLKAIPQVIAHEEFDGQLFKATQLVWVSFDMPATPSPKALAMNFFKAVDSAIGTDYYQEWSAKYKQNVDAFYGAMQVIITTHHIGLVHLDEVQFLLKYANKKDSPNFQIIESLFNKLGVPLVMSMTSQGLELFDSELSNDTRLGLDITTARRMLSDRQFSFKLHNYGSDSFNQLFDALYPESLSTERESPGDEFKQRFHYLSCGLTAVMVRLARMHHETIIELRKNRKDVSTGDIAILNRIYKGQFNLIDSALQQLRYGHHSSYEKSITSDGQEKATFSNQEVKKQNAKQKEKLSIPAVDKNNDRTGTSVASSHDLLPESKFLSGMDHAEADHG